VKRVLTFPLVCDIIISSRGEGNKLYSNDNHSQRGEKVLGEGRTHLARLEKIFQKYLKNPLTNPTRCGIIYM
jgi:hypothetical protein